MSLRSLPNGHSPRSIPQHSKEKDLPGGWVVQKFGGTSIGKFAKNIAVDIVKWAFLAQALDEFTSF